MQQLQENYQFVQSVNTIEEQTVMGMSDARLYGIFSNWLS